MRSIFFSRKLVLGTAMLLAFLLITSFADRCGAAESYLHEQLALVARFSRLQNSDIAAPLQQQHPTRLIESFLQAAQASTATEFTDKSSEDLAAFFEFAFAGEQSEDFSRVNKILQIAGRVQFARENFGSPNPAEKPFSGHVKEAIKINKARAKFYASISSGETGKLSKLYTSLEYCLLPLAAIFDKWGQHYQKMGIPVLLNDFVSMTLIPDAQTQLVRTGKLNAESVKCFKDTLRCYQKNVFAAAARKDFVQIQIATVQALHSLRQLELQNNCNLSLSIHFTESIGLAARNADLLSRKFMKKTDNFYRAFIVLQTAGIRLFSTVDLQAQAFHQAGIGIITNDLPPINFP